MTKQENELLNKLLRRMDRLEEKISVVIGPEKLRQKFWTTKQVCEFLSLSRNCVYKYANQLGGHKIGNGKKTVWRFKPELVEGFKLPRYERN